MWKKNENQLDIDFFQRVKKQLRVGKSEKNPELEAAQKEKNELKE